MSDPVEPTPAPAMPPVVDDASEPSVPTPVPSAASGPSMLDLAVRESGPTPGYAPPPPFQLSPANAAHTGKRPTDDDDDDDNDAPPKRPWSRRTILFAAGGMLLAIVIALSIVLGHFNQERLALRCEPDRIVAMQGRGFPPWGDEIIDAPELAAITIPKDTECSPRTTTNRVELEDWYLTALMEQATGRLASRVGTDVDLASKQLEQALLLTRDPSRRDARKEVDRLLGDVAYWRAAARLQASSDALLEAATQFDAAAKKRPRHATDAAQWAAHVRRLVEALRAGPLDPTTAPTANGSAVVPNQPVVPPLPPLNGGSAAAPTTTEQQPPTPPATGGVLL